MISLVSKAPALDKSTDLTFALRHLIAARCKTVLDYREALAADPTADSIHDARVATRRLRAALSLHRFSPRDQQRSASQQVQVLGHALGAVRDHDVNLSWLEASIELAQEAGTLQGLHWLRGQLMEERAQALGALSLCAGRFFAEHAPAIEHLAGTLHGGPGRVGGWEMRRRLQKKQDEVREWLEKALARDGAPDLCHMLRIAAKKLRYRAELLEDVFKRAHRLVKELPDLQDLLGGLHDCDQRVRWLPERLVQAPQENWPGLALLLRRAQEERRARWKDAPQILRRFAAQVL